MTTQEPSAKTLDEVLAMLHSERVSMLTTADGDRFVSRPMAVLDIDEDNVLWTIIDRHSDKAEQVAADSRVNLSVAGDDFVSVSGRAEVVQDAARAAELWSVHVEAWMQCKPDDEKVGLLKITPDTIGYWETPSAPGYLVGLAKGLIGDHQPDSGEHGVVQA